MDDIILRVSRHYITGIIGILGLGTATYFMRRYLSNNKKTTNSYYTRSDEINNSMNSIILQSTNTNLAAKKIIIFWNGSFNSTYLLLDYLQQDYIVQPLYIERYTIRKALEQKQLQQYTDEYNKSRATSVQCSSKVLEYLADVAKIKKQQEKEISQMVILRRVINIQYSEFHTNLLPTRYITVIEKDLAHSQVFYNALRELDLSPLKYAGIELFEQASRYILHMSSRNSPEHPEHPEINLKVVLAYSQDSHLTSIIKSITQSILYTKQNNIRALTNQSTLPTKGFGTLKPSLELPLSSISNHIIKYLALGKINKEIIQFLKSSSNN